MHRSVFLDLDHDVGFVVQAEGRPHLVHVGAVHLRGQVTVGGDQRVRRADLARVLGGNVRVALVVDGSAEGFS